MSRGDQQVAVISPSLTQKQTTMLCRLLTPVNSDSSVNVTAAPLLFDQALRASPDWADLARLYQQYRIKKVTVSYEPLSRYNWTPPTGYSLLNPCFVVYGVAGSSLSTINSITNVTARLFSRDDPFQLTVSVAPTVGQKIDDIVWYSTTSASAELWGYLVFNNTQSTSNGDIYSSPNMVVSFEVDFRERV